MIEVRIEKCICKKCHAPADPRDRYCRNCGRRFRGKTAIDFIATAAERMCNEYCRFPYEWDEEKEGIPLNESEYCKNCPLSEMLGENDAQIDEKTAI